MRHLIASFGYAISGLGAVMLGERNGRIHLAIALGAVVAGFVLGLSRADWLWITGAIALVVIAEAFNSAIEILCDTVHPERAEGIRRTKDIAAGAVLAAALASAVIGVLVFWPYLLG